MVGKTIHNVDIDSLISENKRLEGENGDKNSQVITLQKDKKVLEERISDNQKELDVVKYSALTWVPRFPAQSHYGRCRSGALSTSSLQRYLVSCHYNNYQDISCASYPAHG